MNRRRGNYQDPPIGALQGENTDNDVQTDTIVCCILKLGAASLNECGVIKVGQLCPALDISVLFIASRTVVPMFS
jgi:hypothetical protein